MDAELLGQCVHPLAVRAGCSHSVHFLLREGCSRSFLWFRRRTDQWVIRLPPGEVGIVTNPLIPRGNKPLNPWSPVPAVLHCAHPHSLRFAGRNTETAAAATVIAIVHQNAVSNPLASPAVDTFAARTTATIAVPNAPPSCCTMRVIAEAWGHLVCADVDVGDGHDGG